MIQNVIVFVVSYDVWFYFSHLILHKKGVYKTIHYIHHSSDPKTLTYRDTHLAHSLESPFQCVGILIPVLFMKFHLPAFLFSLFIITLRGMLRHDTNSIWLIGNHHILHHKYQRYNFGEYWLDYLFGTTYPNQNEYKRGLIYM
jgi:sterol desaturase/sphingolipid hydroxylase (fatty acid hydroxylase superfamily)